MAGTLSARPRASLLAGLSARAASGSKAGRASFIEETASLASAVESWPKAASRTLTHPKTMNGSMNRGATTSGIWMWGTPALADSASRFPPKDMETMVAPLAIAVFIMARVSSVLPEALHAIARQPSRSAAGTTPLQTSTSAPRRA